MTEIFDTKAIVGGKEYPLTNLNFKGLQEVCDYLPYLFIPNDGGIRQENMRAILKVGTAMLKRKNPEITEEFIADNLEDYEIADFIVAITQEFQKKSRMITEKTSESTGTESMPS